MYKHHEEYKSSILVACGILKSYIKKFSHELSIEDIQQNACLRLIKSVKKFDENKGEYKKYTIRVAINSIKSLLMNIDRRKKILKKTNKCSFNLNVNEMGIPYAKASAKEKIIQLNETKEFIECAIADVLMDYKHSYHYEMIAFSINYDLKSGKLINKEKPLMKDVVKKYGITKQMVSLVLKNFRKRLKDKLER